MSKNQGICKSLRVLSSVSSAREDVNKPDVKNEEERGGGGGAQPCWLTDVLPTRMWYTRSLMLGFSRSNWHRSSISGHQPVLNTLAPCSAAPPSLRRAVAFIHMRRRRDNHVGGGLARVGVGSGAAPPPLPPQYRTDQGFQRRPSVRDEETWRWQLLSTGAVPTALHTVEYLLLQFFPLLLLLGQALSWWFGRALAVVQDFAVLGVPQVCI